MAKEKSFVSDSNSNSKMERTVNNRFPGSPAVMDDGRSFTDYRCSMYVDSMIMQANGITSSNDYRRFLMERGTELRKVNDVYLERKLEQSCSSNARPPQNFHKKCTVRNEDGSISCLIQDPTGVGSHFTTSDPSQTVEGYCRMSTNFGPAH